MEELLGFGDGHVVVIFAVDQHRGRVSRRDVLERGAFPGDIHQIPLVQELAEFHFFVLRWSWHLWAAKPPPPEGTSIKGCDGVRGFVLRHCRGPVSRPRVDTLHRGRLFLGERLGDGFFCERLHNGESGLVRMDSIAAQSELQAFPLVCHGGKIIEIDAPLLRAVMLHP